MPLDAAGLGGEPLVDELLAERDARVVVEVARRVVFQPRRVPPGQADGTESPRASCDSRRTALLALLALLAAAGRTRCS